MLSHRGHDHAWVYKFIVIFRCLILGCSAAYDPHIAKRTDLHTGSYQGKKAAMLLCFYGNYFNGKIMAYDLVVDSVEQ